MIFERSVNSFINTRESQCRAAGAPEGMMPGTMPEGMPQPDSHFTSQQGPKVEEVD